MSSLYAPKELRLSPVSRGPKRGDETLQSVFTPSLCSWSGGESRRQGTCKRLHDTSLEILSAGRGPPRGEDPRVALKWPEERWHHQLTERRIPEAGGKQVYRLWNGLLAHPGQQAAGAVALRAPGESLKCQTGAQAVQGGAKMLRGEEAPWARGLERPERPTQQGARGPRRKRTAQC